MDVKELQQTHPLYDNHIDEWNYNQLAYDGGKDFINNSIERQSRESEANWEARQKAGICFNYARSVVDIYSFYLTEQHPVRELKALANDKLFNLFEKDCDFNGTDFDYFMVDCQKLASVAGAVGILVDKPAGVKINTRDTAVKNKIYPYCSAYTLPNILDWKHERINGRQELVSLKLRESNGDIVIWTQGAWERWSVIDGKDEKEAVLIDQGIIPLKIIPFIWMQNIKSITRPLVGLSDITEIARITASIIRDISCADEVIKYAGFPMLRKPMRASGDNSSDIVGITGILEFDPETGAGGKPDWLLAPVKEPIDAIMRWVNKKAGEAYNAAHLGGVAAQEVSDKVRSGVAMRYEFQQLARVLTAKAINMNEAELKIINLFCLWQGIECSGIIINRPTDFSVDDLSMTLENLDIARQIVNSETFEKELQKVIVRKTVSHSTSDSLNTMYAEIEAGGPIVKKGDFSLRDKSRQDTGYSKRQTQIESN